MAAGAANQSAIRRKELRIAPVMTGGTSLSVWMGGVTAELYSMLAAGTQNQVATSNLGEPATVPMYRALLELADLEPRVDVITGTSAGGLNGTLLAAAWRCWVPAAEFLKMRETWLQLGDLKQLLRSPNEADPPSLLKGDAYFRVEIEKVLDGWRQQAPEWKKKAGSTDEPQLDRAAQHPLDLLITVTTVTPEARSRRDDYGETISDVNHAHRLRFDDRDLSDYSSRAEWPTKLAIASRTSACIPGVFEPSYLPVNADDAKKAGLPDFTKHASFNQSHYAVDGGVVVNLPLKEALERVFYQPADAPVRRVVMFIQPTPSVKAQKPAKPTEPPTIRESVTTVFSAPRAEGLTEQVDRVHEHNRSVGRQASMRRSLHAVVGDDLVARANELMPVYRKERTASSVRHTVDYIARSLDGHEVDRGEVEAELTGPRCCLVPHNVARVGTAVAPHQWGWGIAPIEHAGSMVLGLIRSAPPAVQTELAVPWRRVSEALTEVRAIRELDRAHWDHQLGELLEQVDDAQGEPSTTAIIDNWADAAYNTWPSGKRNVTLDRLRRCFDAIVCQLPPIAQVIRSQADEAISDTLLADLEVLAPTQPSPGGLGARLRAIHVLQTVLLGDIVQREQNVELQIVSWNAVDHVSGRTAGDKLAGPELARLGAFLKRSWRANDWCWGRLDGAGRLTELLLDREHLTEALRHPGRNAEAAIDAFVQSPAFNFDDGEQAGVRELLQQMTDSESSAPDAHRELVGIVAKRLQVAAAAEELPEVAKAIRYSIDEEQSNEWNGAEFLRIYEQPGRVPGPDSTGELLAAMKVGEESVGTELGYGLLNRTISRGSAVAVNALSSDTAGVAAVSKVLRPLRTPLHTVNSVVATATSGTPLHRFLSTLAFAIGGALVGLRLAGVTVATPLLVAAEILLAGALAAALVRSGFLRQLPLLLIVTTVLGLTIVGEDIDDVLFSTSQQYETIELPAGALVVLGPNGLVEITTNTDGQELTDDLLLPGATIKVSASDAQLRQPVVDATPAPWKNRLFLEQAWMRWVLIVVSFWLALLLLRYVRSRDDETPRSWKATVAAGLGTALLAAFGVLLVTNGFTSASKWALTGKPGDDCLKDRVSDTASALGDYRIEIVVLVMITVAVMLGHAYDLVLRRLVRRIRLFFAR